MEKGFIVVLETNLKLFIMVASKKVRRKTHKGTGDYKYERVKNRKNIERGESETDLLPTFVIIKKSF